eukprot:CAMPEP_0194160424 /NCGR_PEP_ID=MMETSP0152-20130528/78383_1 /TAXON_ID=1049557 /ORGANISM="Thalassiothrix antarctica, Strain L6-D1" /LENGTH=130 /DNA_ID=CAMNT_0038870113 /DNA_START=1733 /DNA_END=2128 /DNA_ORIENTATION=-
MKTSSNSRSSTTKVSSSNSNNTILDDSGSSNEESIISSSNSLNTNIPDLESTDIPDPASPCVLQVLGVGGDEGKAVNRTIETGIQGTAMDHGVFNKDLPTKEPNAIPTNPQLLRSDNLPLKELVYFVIAS